MAMDMIATVRNRRTMEMGVIPTEKEKPMGLVFSSLYIIKLNTGSESNLTVRGLFREMPAIV